MRGRRDLRAARPSHLAYAPVAVDDQSAEPLPSLGVVATVCHIPQATARSLATIKKRCPRASRPRQPSCVAMTATDIATSKTELSSVSARTTRRTPRTAAAAQARPHAVTGPQCRRAGSRRTMSLRDTIGRGSRSIEHRQEQPSTRFWRSRLTPIRTASTLAPSCETPGISEQIGPDTDWALPGIKKAHRGRRES
jgi:hypothetical protein